MREHKYRVWDGIKLDYDCESLTIWHGMLVPEGDGIIEEGTGIKDKDAVEVYEGDVIKGKYNTNNGMKSMTGVVCIDVLDGTWVKPGNQPSLDLDSIWEIEVIGHIQNV